MVMDCDKVNSSTAIMPSVTEWFGCCEWIGRHMRKASDASRP